MKIALLGYGKMGKEIEKIALSRNHQIVLTIDIDNQKDLSVDNLKKADVAIDFSTPASAYNNIMKCFESGIPIVCGTTGWLEKIDIVKEKCLKENRAFFYASNYSLGANVFFRLNKYLANMMSKLSDYQVEIEEVHHIHKLDAPSGTAITLAEGIIENMPAKTGWILNQPSNKNNIGIKAIREGEVPGIHRIKYNSAVDYIHIEHSAYSRHGLALGAVLAAEFMKGKTGFRSMDDLLDIG